MAYGDSKDLPRWIANDKVLRDKAFNIAKNTHEWYQRGVASMVNKFFDKKTLCCAVKDNIWGTDLAGMQLTNKRNKWFPFLLCIIDIHSKQVWAIPLEDKKGIPITKAFQEILDESNCKTNKIWVDKGCGFCNKSMKLWSQDNNVEMHSTQNEGKSVVTKRFIRTLKKRIYKYTTSVS